MSIQRYVLGCDLKGDVAIEAAVAELTNGELSEAGVSEDNTWCKASDVAKLEAAHKAEAERAVTIAEKRIIQSWEAVETRLRDEMAKLKA